MLVRLPGHKSIVVDAKAPLMAYLEALEATDDEERAAKLKDHAQQIRTHMVKLSAKAYWDACPGTPELVVLFLPGEMFFSAALQHDPALIEDGAVRRVILATPTTLIALLKSVSYGWREQQIAENAQRISGCAQELHERLGTMVEHLARLGASLDRSIEDFNAAIGSFEGRVLPAARRFKELGTASKKEIGELTPIDKTARALLISHEEETLPPLELKLQ
jgi:DNA recombination protein RmuC